MRILKEDALLASRRVSSISKKGMFSTAERRFLTSYSASLCMERRMVNEIYLHSLLERSSSSPLLISVSSPI